MIPKYNREKIKQIKNNGIYTSSSFFLGSRTGGSISIPMLAAVPAITLIADSIVVQFKSGSFSAAIVRNCSMVTLPTFSIFGSLEPFSTPTYQSE